MAGKTGRAAAGALAALLVAAAMPAAADYPERHIDMIITYGPGGGFDIYARAVGRMMEKSLPQGVKVIPRNMPGAGGKRGTAALYRAAADGYTMGILNLPGMVEPQILGEPVHYDLDKVTWLGGINIGVYSLVVAGNSRFSSLDDLRKSPRETFFATTGSNDFAMAKIMAAVLKLNAKFLTGYKGGPDTHLAIIRGEADAGMGIDVTIKKKVAAKDLKALVSFQQANAKPLFPGVPTAADIGHPELANLGLYRLFAAPPGLPAAVRTKLTEIVQKAVNDPELAAWAEKSNFPINPSSAEETKKMYVEQKAFLSRFKHLLKK